jgi:hypothetical protein
MAMRAGVVVVLKRRPRVVFHDEVVGGAEMAKKVSVTHLFIAS